jgi:ATP-dependent Clp protease protease subunit
MACLQTRRPPQCSESDRVKTFFAKTSGKRAEVYIYESIGEGWYGGITAKSFSDAMKEIGKASALDVYINSPGGSVFDGISIYNQIRRFDGERVVHIDGIAASIASVIAMAGDKIQIAGNGMVMIHDPWSMAYGTADEMRKQADALDQIRVTILDTYVARTGGKKCEISDWMAAETWMTADEAVERGFATAKSEESALKAEFPMLAKFRNAPQELKRQATASGSLLARMHMRSLQLNRRASPSPA